MIHLIYCSTAKHIFSRSELSVMLINARKKNVQMGINGILLYSDGSFFQVLEGEGETVDRLFEEISRDDRHRNVTVIIREAIPERVFGDWTMAYSDISPEEADTILGASDFSAKARHLKIWATAVPKSCSTPSNREAGGPGSVTRQPPHQWPIPSRHRAFFHPA